MEIKDYFLKVIENNSVLLDEGTGLIGLTDTEYGKLASDLTDVMKAFVEWSIVSVIKEWKINKYVDTENDKEFDNTKELFSYFIENVYKE